MLRSRCRNRSETAPAVSGPRRTRRLAGRVASARRLVRRVRRVAMVVSVATALFRVRAARRAAAEDASARPAGAAQWPPLHIATPAPAASDLPVSDASSDDTPAPAAGFAGDSVVVEPDATPAVELPSDDAPWVAPVDGACPLTHPVKGNGSSRIYHVPGSRFYDRTRPERCYRDAAAAEADGMRAPKG